MMLVAVGGHEGAIAVIADHCVTPKTSKNIVKQLIRGETLVKHGETLVKHGETLVKHGETLVKHGETLVKHGETHKTMRNTC